MDSLDDDFSYYLDLYKDNYIAYGLDDNEENKKILDKAKRGLETTHDKLFFKKTKLDEDNNSLRKKINSMNKIIKRNERKNKELTDITQEFKNNDAGAIEQNINTMEVYKKRRLQTFLEVGLILLILIFGYINGDIIQAIRSKLPTKTK
jgi:hypothetical protein